jgi:hypothetical protein
MSSHRKSVGLAPSADESGADGAAGDGLRARKKSAGNANKVADGIPQKNPSQQCGTLE